MKEKGRLYGDWRRVEREIFKPAYKWLCVQMEQRGIELHGRCPMWAWAKKPDLRGPYYITSGETAYRLELEVPDDLVLLSHFGAWHCVLNDHFLVTSDDELAGMFDHPRHEVEESWLKIFDREAIAAVPGYDDVYQATFPTIELDYVIKETRFTGR